MTDVQNLSVYTATPRQTRKYVLECLYAGVVPFIQSSPGIGKSSITRSIAEELSLKMIDHRCSTSAPEDFNGLPRFTPEGRAVFAPFNELFPLQDDPIPQGKDGWLLFFDEFNSAPKTIQAACYKIVLDRQIGQHPLHDRVGMVLAGNLATDRAITNNLSTAMQSRLVHIKMVHDFTEWLEDVAIPMDYDARIIGYLSYKEDNLMDFRPDHQDLTFACPRTWEFMNKLISGKKKLDDDMVGLYAGTMTSGIALDFFQFAKVAETMIKIEDVLHDPKGLNIPTDKATQWNVISHLAQRVDGDTFEKVSEFADRFEISMRVLFYRMALLRQPKLREHPAFRKAASTVVRYLNNPTFAIAA